MIIMEKYHNLQMECSKFPEINPSFELYVGRSNQRGTKAVTRRPFDLQPCTWCLLKRTLGLFNGPKSQIDSSYHEKLASDLLKAVLPPPTPLRD